MTAKRPNSMRHLDDAIRRICGGSAELFVRTRTIMANALVASMLPDGVVKGGSALKMRFGDAATRFTTDLDTATAMDPERYALELDTNLRRGWEGFCGRVVPRDPASPENVPEEYIMRPYDVKLEYRGKPWCTVPLEVGHNELGDADTADVVCLQDVDSLFESLGFPPLKSVSLMSLEHQIAQKIHAVSTSGDRARDLVDLQLIFERTDVDLLRVRGICERLFAYRHAQTWPPSVLKRPGWDDLYAEQASGLPVLQDVNEAIEWARGIVVLICNAS